MFSGLDLPWWLFFLVVAVIAAGVWFLLRSLKKWQQPARGTDPESRRADEYLEDQTRRNTSNW